MQLTINDSAGKTWEVWVDVTGHISLSLLGSLPAPPLYYLNPLDGSTGSSYLLIVDISAVAAQLAVIAVAYNSSYPLELEISGPMSFSNGISELEIGADIPTDNGGPIASRYTTYGFADQAERAQLQMGQDRVIYPYGLANIEGVGQLTIALLPETIDTPYPFTQAPFKLSMPALDDINVPLNCTGNRAFLQIDSQPASWILQVTAEPRFTVTPGDTFTNWSLKRFLLATSDDPRMRITGK